MATTPVPDDFSAFLKYLNENEVEYLVIGGYAVGFHGYTRVTDDMDVWIAIRPDNAERMVNALKAFGFGDNIESDLFLREGQIIRMGVAPVRIEIATTISGVDFNACYEHRVEGELGGVRANFISLEDLRKNKTASARKKDLADLDHLPDT